MHSVDPKYKKSWQLMDVLEIKERLYKLAPYCHEVTLSGGNPLLYDLTELVDLLHFFNYSVNVETQATIYRPWVAKLDTITLSPKPPSAGAIARDNLKRLDYFLECLTKDLDNEGLSHVTPICIKVPVDVDGYQFQDDYRFARDAFRVARQSRLWTYPYFSLVTHPEDNADSLLVRYRKLVEMVSKDREFEDVTILPQVHVLLWSHEKGR